MNVIAATLNAKYIHTCLALRYLKAFAEPDFPVEIAEYTIKDPAMNIVTDLYERKPDVVGFSCYIWNIEETIEVVSMLKKIDPALTIVLGGPEVSYDTDYWMKRLPEVDFIVMGEGEETFKHLLEELSGEKKFHMVFGTAYRKDGKVRINPPRPKVELADVPSPYRFQEDTDALSKRITYFETSRGCPFSCQFCLSSIENGVRYFDIEKVKSDLLYLIENGAKMIKFVDRTFNIQREYAREIFQFLIDNHQGCQFQFEITADIMPPELLQFLNDHAPPGIFRFEIGVQSTNDATNKLVKRHQNLKKLERTVTMVKEGGKIDQHLDLIAGLPEEDYDRFKQTFNDVFAMEPEELQLGFLKMLRGTGLRIQAEDYGYVYMDNAPYEMLSNNVLSFADIARIKRVEDILEKYWNDHRMDHTIEYLVTHCFPTAFDFFQEFGDYWHEKGWGRIGHQLEDLFLRLEEFLTYKNIENIDIIKGLMTYDYYLHQKHRPRKTWTAPVLSKEEQTDLARLFANYPEIVHLPVTLKKQDWQKHTVSELLPFSLKTYIETGNIVKHQELLLIHYDVKNQTKTTRFIPYHTIEQSLPAVP
ncbi:anaerobic magnesium-protoporphyrin IX monomethyl ester cyclase [Alteribacillus persepolensis]|uniref:Anaerobic magnesium-protoporphyrin IX monomethyl ester cyclase n=1 Tax=Alteribacillus persepolensis TaxID=568899 RepID=A0A1G8H5I3_9BACI|nr:B12-binding domain-containing radical SAM protein [Alteribacillus persepolensis]SDI01927.1 anaerobic magnesium-protoporphyrin IX monomethyl ester cyclase [Alteribacillus persepolensis]